MTRIIRSEQGPAVARHQAGVFTRAQALSEGWSYWQIRERVRSGRWMLLPGQNITASPEHIDAEAVAWSAHLALPAAVLSHTTAGALMRFPVPADHSVAHVITSRHQVATGLIGHRDTPSLGHTLIQAGLPVTSRARTALDCLGILAWLDQLRLWAWVCSRGILTIEQLACAVRERFASPGNANLLRLLAWARDGALSEAERRMHKLLRAAGISGWRANARICDGSGTIIAVADILFVLQRLIIEVDGFEAHSGTEAFVNDRRRQNALVNAGYRVLRVTWRDLTERPQQLMAEIRAAITP